MASDAVVPLAVLAASRSGDAVVGGRVGGAVDDNAGHEQPLLNRLERGAGPRTRPAGTSAADFGTHGGVSMVRAVHTIRRASA